MGDIMAIAAESGVAVVEAAASHYGCYAKTLACDLGRVET